MFSLNRRNRYAIGGAILAILLILGPLSPKLSAQGSTPVTVVNPTYSPVNTRDVSEISKQPFVESESVVLFPGLRMSGSPLIFTPAGKRRVIESASFEARLPTGQTLFIQLRLEPGPSGAPRFFALPSTFQGTMPNPYRGNALGDVFVSAQSMRAYVPSKSSFFIYVERSSVVGELLVTITYSGYLEDSY